jgi:AraC family transcriptional regulator
VAQFEVDAEAVLPTAHVQLVRLDHPGPSESVFRPKGVYWIDLCLTPRRPSARARYVDRWGPHRFHGMGSIIALPPDTPLQLQSAGGRHASLICALKAEAVDRWLPADFEWNDRRVEACLDISSAQIRGLLLRLALELRRPGVASEALMDSIVFQLSIEIARYLVAISEPTETGGLAAWRLRTIDKRLAEPGEAPSLGELASLCNMSVRQLTRGFRTSRGCSIGDYMAQSRMEAAKRRLSSGESIKAIATSMGYASQSNFAFAFRRATGVTPSQFRTRVLRGGERQPAGA